MYCQIRVNELGEPELWVKPDNSTERFAINSVRNRLGLTPDPLTGDFVLMPRQIEKAQ